MELSSLTALKKVVLRNENRRPQFTGATLFELGATFERLSNLQHFDISGNGGGARTLTNAFTTVNKMERLYLNGNIFEFELSSLGLEAMTNLVQLDLSDNLFYGTIPTELAQLTKLGAYSLSVYLVAVVSLLS